MGIVRVEFSAVLAGTASTLSVTDNFESHGMIY